MSVGSGEENDAVLKYYVFDELSLTDLFWIGLHRKGDAEGEDFEKDYEWVDGSLNDYKHFSGKTYKDIKVSRSLTIEDLIYHFSNFL